MASKTTFKKIYACPTEGTTVLQRSDDDVANMRCPICGHYLDLMEGAVMELDGQVGTCLSNLEIAIRGTI